MLFIDASALTAVIVGESDAGTLLDRLALTEARLVSGIALWETAIAVARIKKTNVIAAWAEVERFRTSLDLRVMSIDLPVTAKAVHAHDTYGRGTGHAARLNMGDCFAYACARANGARLLYKGDDFVHTDLG